MLVADVINRGAVLLDMDATEKPQVLDALSERLFMDGAITSKKAFLTDVYAREREGKTGIGDGLAIPHGKSASVIKTCVAIGRSRGPVAWETIDGEPVRLIILFAAKLDDKDTTFVKLLSQVARAIADEEACERLMNASTVDQVVAVFGA